LIAFIGYVNDPNKLQQFNLPSQSKNAKTTSGELHVLLPRNWKVHWSWWWDFWTPTL